jgi:hypothetical protein
VLGPAARAPPWRLTVAPPDEKDVSCCTGPVSRRSKCQSRTNRCPLQWTDGGPGGHSSTLQAS